MSARVCARERERVYARALVCIYWPLISSRYSFETDTSTTRRAYAHHHQQARPLFANTCYKDLDIYSDVFADFLLTTAGDAAVKGKLTAVLGPVNQFIVSVFL